MDEQSSKYELWNKLADIWGAETWLRSELWSGRDRLGRERLESNYRLEVCQELTPSQSQYITWIGVKATKDVPISPGSADVWSGLGQYDYVLTIHRDGRVEIGSVSLLSGMPTDLYSAWREADKLLDSQLTALLETKSQQLSDQLGRLNTA